MAAILTILLPIFGLVLAGYGCRRIGVFGPAAAIELNRFVVWLALPALLFDIIVHSSWQQLWQPRFIATFGLATTAVFMLVLVVRLRRGRHLVDAAVDAMAASYSNTGYVGFPLSLLAFGRSSQTPATIATLFVVCLLFSLALVLIEIGLNREVSASKVATKLASSLSRNPLLAGPAAGLAVAAFGWQLPGGVETFFRLLGSSASPCALVSLGVFLAEKARQDRSRPRRRAAARRHEAAAAAPSRLAARQVCVRPATAAGRHGGAADRPADRHRPVHAGRSTTSARRWSARAPCCCRPQRRC